MEARCLRVGNKVQDNNGFIFDVVSIFKDGTIYCDFEENEGDVWEFDKNNPCQGIELTEEILLKCGFYYDTDYLTFCISTCTIQLDYYGNEGYMCIIFGEDLYLIKHLHQLQNLYYALTNEELNVQL